MFVLLQTAAQMLFLFQIRQTTILNWIVVLLFARKQKKKSFVSTYLMKKT